MERSVTEDIVTFFPNEKLIKIKRSAVDDNGAVAIDAVRDIYSGWKRWAHSEEGIVFGELVKAEGGVVLPTGYVTDVHVILQGSWKIQLPNEAVTVTLYGNLHSNDSMEPIVAKPDGEKVIVRKVSRKEDERANRTFFVSFAFIGVGVLILFAWILSDPCNFEPYATLAITLFTLNQFVSKEKWYLLKCSFYQFWGKLKAKAQKLLNSESTK